MNFSRLSGGEGGAFKLDLIFFFLPELISWEPLRTKEGGLEVLGFWRGERELTKKNRVVR